MHQYLLHIFQRWELNQFQVVLETFRAPPAAEVRGQRSAALHLSRVHGQVLRAHLCYIFSPSLVESVTGASWVGKCCGCQLKGADGR